jgi:hypothetical protein
MILPLGLQYEVPGVVEMRISRKLRPSLLFNSAPDPKPFGELLPDVQVKQIAIECIAIRVRRNTGPNCGNMG